MLPASLDGLSLGMIRFVGNWSAHVGDVERLAEAAAAAQVSADASDDPVDRTRAAGLSAQLAAISGDTARALELLEANPPMGPRDELLWDMDYALPGERLLLAELLLAQGEYERAISVAAGFESRPVVYLLYMPKSLELRAKAAKAMGDSEREATFRRRLQAMVHGS